MIRVWVVLAALWCVVVFGWVYKLAVDGAVRLAVEQATDGCSHDTGDKHTQCVQSRSVELRAKYNATVSGYLGRILSGERPRLLLGWHSCAAVADAWSGRWWHG
jgi:hypothetical protein